MVAFLAALIIVPWTKVAQNPEFLLLCVLERLNDWHYQCYHEKGWTLGRILELSEFIRGHPLGWTSGIWNHEWVRRADHAPTFCEAAQTRQSWGVIAFAERRRWYCSVIDGRCWSWVHPSNWSQLSFIQVRLASALSTSECLLQLP